jgi:drug/metabolite transporter (DMT)-like permease
MGGLALTWDFTANAFGASRGAGLIAAACLCWAIDNNLTRRISSNDAMAIACVKGLLAGGVNLTFAAAWGIAPPEPGVAVIGGLVGLAGFGFSLVLFVHALRNLGAARTGAYFSLAPFFGAAAAIPLVGEPFTPQLGVAAGLMAIGTWLHVTERHHHWHAHAVLEHEHVHRHDDHHRHDHGPGDAND